MKTKEPNTRTITVTGRAREAIHDMVVAAELMEQRSYYGEVTSSAVIESWKTLARSLATLLEGFGDEARVFRDSDISIDVDDSCGIYFGLIGHRGEKTLSWQFHS